MMKKSRMPPRADQATTANSIPAPLQASVFHDLGWLAHGFSTRLGGVSSFLGPAPDGDLNLDLNLGKVPWDSPRNVAENRRRLVAAMRSSEDAGEMRLVVLRQIHSDLIRHVDRPTGSGMPSAGDALITNQRGVLLSILSADCLPILLADTRQRVVAAIHCGWRGTARRLAEKVVGRMRMMFNSRPRDLRAAIGPGIRACCYKVGPDVREEFESQFADASKFFVCRNEPPNPLEAQYQRLFNTYKSPEFKTFHDLEGDHRQLHLDLVLANVSQLQAAGLARSHIDSGAACTSCHPELFFSHRRDGGRTGRMMGLIGIRK